MKKTYRFVFALLCLLPSMTALPRPLQAAAPCFDARVEYRGRAYVSTVGNVQFFRWTYRMYGQGCINRALSHWTIQLCADAQVLMNQTSNQCVDASDMANGPTTNYSPVRGPDPTTGLTGIKWNTAAGNPIDKAEEYDEFSFVASGNVTTVNWAAKAAQIILTGTTFGPSCLPVPVENVTWSRIKGAAYNR